jgi:hypothetical protein
MWQDEVLGLSETVVTWSQQLGYSSKAHQPEPGSALLEIIAGANRFYLEPMEFAAQQLPAVVWLYSYPTMSRVRLVGPIEGQWEIQSSDGIPFHKTLDIAEFQQLLSDLSANVA